MLNTFMILFWMEQRILIFKKVLIFIFLLIFALPAQSEKIIKGKARIVDGDTIEVNYIKIRLHGIDAPEIKQSCSINNVLWLCGIESEKALKKLISNKDVNCDIIDKDRYKRSIGICFVNNQNINEYMVRNGWAIAYRYYSDDYIDQEERQNKKNWEYGKVNLKNRIYLEKNKKNNFKIIKIIYNYCVRLKYLCLKKNPNLQI